MKTIGIKLADGTFYPILEEGSPKKRMLDLTTAKDNQTKVQIDLYRSESGSMADAEYVDTLEVTKLVPHPNGEPELHLSLGLDEDNNLTAEVVDPETGKKSETAVNLVSRTVAENASPADFAPAIKDDSSDKTLAEPTAEDFAFADFAGGSANNIASSDDLPEIKSDALEDMPFSFDDNDTASSEKTEKPAAEIGTDSLDDFGIDDDTLEGMDFTKPAEGESTLSGEESVPDDFGSEDSTLQDTATSDFDLPDFDSDSADSGATGIDFGDLPDFDDKTLDSSSSEKDEKLLAAENDIDNAFDTSSLDAFDTSDLDASLDKLGVSNQPEEKAGYTKGSAMDFSDLYDKETLEGAHASLYNDDEKKKTRVPVVICIICAIICVIATILILFVVPSKYNLIKSRNTRNAETSSETVITKEEDTEKYESAAPVEETPIQIVVSEEPEQKEEAPAAQEDKIVVAPEPEKVVPEPAPKAEKKPDAKYHIRWGDTLWDLSESYYKTPWKYKKIARYNNIKNPDLIISGTDILIPAE